MLRKTFTALLVFLTSLSLLLTACGDNTPTTSVTTAATTTQAATTAAGTTTTATATTQAAAIASGQSVTLKYISWMSKGEDKPILADFMKKYPNIKVEDQILDGGTYDQLLKPRFTSGDAPDVFLFMPQQLAPYVKEGWLADVTNEPGTAPLKQNKALADSYTVNGKIYGSMVNGNYGDLPVYYNKKLFAKLGLSIPKTTDEFLAACDKIKAAGVDPIVVGGKDSWTVGLLPSGFYTADAYGKFKGSDPLIKLVKGEGKVEDIYSDPISFFGNLVQKGYIGKASLTLTYDQSVQYFADGKAAMVSQGPWVPGLDSIKKANPNQFELGAFAFPYTKTDGKIATSAGSDRSIGISASTKNLDAAKLLYNFFLDKPNIKKYLETQSLTTIVPGIDPTVDPSLADYIKVHQDSSQYQVYVGYSDPQTVTLPPAWSKAEGDLYVNLLAGSTAAEELSKLKDTLDKVKGQATFANK